MADGVSGGGHISQLGNIVFGPRWDQPTLVGASDGNTYIREPVYRDEMVKLLSRLAELEARLATLEAKP